MTTRVIENSDLWSAIRGLGLTSKTNAELDEIVAVHAHNIAFASCVIVKAARQVKGGKLNRIAEEGA